MDLTIVGPGRAGMAIALAAAAAGHEIVAVVGRTLGSAEQAAARVSATPVGIDGEIPPSELTLVATRDDIIAEVAAVLAERLPAGDGAGAVHLSGLVPIAALAPLGEAGYLTGAFHPLQTIPTADVGAARLAGAWVGITAGELRPRLIALAESIGMHPFDIADEQKAIYHAAAAAAANFTMGHLAMSSDLFADVGVPFEAARPLVEAIVANAFELGPRSALTGPVVRGDVATVNKQLDAVAAAEPVWLEDFATAVQTLARLSGNGPAFEDMLHAWRRPEEGGG